MDSTRALALNAVQLVIGKIADGTSGGTAAAPLAWASQPGMIRTYDTSGNTYQYHKLYSSGTNMTVTSFALTDDLPPANWKAAPGVWADLNAPVPDSTGTLNYPILDPAAINGTSNGNVKPDGFAITNPPGYASGNGAASDNNQAPMPVRWLYQLKDGTLVPGTGTGNTTTVTGATAANPIVGRIAFWTDDETCKVNVNTAAEGTYWDTPRFYPGGQISLGTVMQGNPSRPTQSEAWKYPDVAFACYQPARFEFQRYPGHPAQVALSSVFPGVTSQIASGLTPRVAWNGTTQGGTVWAGSSTVDPSQAARKVLYATLDEYIFSGNITAGGQRQNNNVGNTLTKYDIEAAKFFCTANSRCPEVNIFNLPRIACWPVDKDLATNPASPKTTAFDRLIAFCSSSLNGATRLPYYFQRSDAQSPTSDYDNIARNQQLYAYLQRLTSAAVPGFGGNFKAKYGDDRDQILTEIFDYIRCANLVDTNLGGYPLAQNSLPNSNCLRLTNQFVPAVRVNYGGSNINLLGLGQAMPIRIGSTVGFGRFAALKEIALVYACVGDGALPSTATCTSAAGVDAYILNAAVPTLSENATLISNIPAVGTNGIPVNAPAPPSVSAYLAANPAEWTRVRQKWINAITTYLGANPTCPKSNAALDGTALAPTERRVQMMVLCRLNNPGAGMVQLNPDLLIRIKGLDTVSVANAMNIGGGGALFTLPATCTDWFYKTKEPWSRVYTQPLGFDSLVGQGAGFSPTWYATALTNGRPLYPFISHAFTMNSSQTISCSSANLTFELYEGKNVFDPANTNLAATYKDTTYPLNQVLGNPNCLHQTANITFPADATIAAPTLDTAISLSNNAYPMYKIETRLTGDNAGANVISVKDSIRARCFNGDGRLAALMTTIPATAFTAYPLLTQHQMGQGNGQVSYPIGGTGSPTAASGMIPPGTAATTGDFDIACRMGPGGFINKPDEGDNSLGTGGTPPYFFFAQDSTNSVLYTPNRIMPSPGMFGSLPTGAKAGVGWKTLLFRPQPNHPSYSTTIPDHLIMDLFWMPVVEPYAVSESFSTAGKVNMNYQIVPFTYIKRSTALNAAMKVEMGTAVPDGAAINFTSAPGIGDPITGGTTWRKNLNLSDIDGSLRQFQAKFDSGDIFRSASQICDIYLVPRDVQWASDAAAQTFWSNNRNTPENLREKPYANLYARLTTKSNTYTVHVRVQSLQKVAATAPDQWVEGQDKVVGEERVSSVLERYLDYSNGTLPDFATDPTAQLSSYYHTRILSTKRFNP